MPDQTRRGALLGFSGAASATLAADSISGATPAASDTLNASVFGLWTDFHLVVIPDGMTLFRSAGYAKAGLGAAAYALDSDQAASPPSAIRRVSANKKWFRLAESVITPQFFGAAGDLSKDDAPSIQAAIDYVEPARGAVHLPAGNYYIGTSLRLPSFVTLEGSFPGSVINNQYKPLKMPQLVNKDPAALIYATVRNLIFRGGEYGIKLNVSAETAGLRFENVGFDLQTIANFQVNKLLQTSKFTNCTFDGAPRGLVVEGPTANANNFIGCEFTNHSQAHVLFRSAEANNFLGCRFEAGGVREGVTLDVENCQSLNFVGCYFEATHTYLISEARSTNTTSFDGCHFTGASYGVGFDPYKFRSDGVINFGTNTWHMPSEGPRQMRVTGYNGGKLGGNNIIFRGDERGQGAFTSQWVSSSTHGARQDLILIHQTVPNGRDGIRTAIIDLTITVTMQDPGSEAKIVTGHYQLGVSAFGDGSLQVQTDTAASANETYFDLKWRHGVDPNDVVVDIASLRAKTISKVIFRWDVAWNNTSNNSGYIKTIPA
jgi:hypothetical protein